MMENHNWRPNRFREDDGKIYDSRKSKQGTFYNCLNNRQKYNNHKSSHCSDKKLSKIILPEIEENPFIKPNLVEYLKTLNTKNSDEIVALVAEKIEDFKKFLNNDMEPDILVSTLKLMTSICKANTTELMIKSISLTMSTNFLKSLELYLKKLPLESDEEKSKNRIYHEDIDRFWYDFVEFSKKVIELLLCTACDKLTVLLQKTYLIISNIEISQKYKIVNTVKIDLMNMIQDLQKEIQKIESVNTLGTKIDLKPPENFRILNVIPKLEDLLDHSKLFLRPCKIKDPYNSVEHYLDIQFRLLQEDFVRPLRNGIREYLDKTQTYRNNDLRIYKNAIITGLKYSSKDVGLQLHFGKLKHVNWFLSKRFMNGSLLLLSKDDCQTIFFATVINRDERDLDKGYVIIQPCQDTQIPQDMYNCNLVVLESKIFFEPYFQVLTAMKKIDHSNFPMESYLIKAETFVKMPDYLRGSKWRLQRYHKAWLTERKLNFDESQLNAFKSALTQEFAIIQGPPGTGKTFLALQVVRALLENIGKWRTYGPIVVVCLTNHALDQFLEGILSATQSIVRVGSRSKNENLNQYTLTESRKRFDDITGNAKSLMYSTQYDLKNLSISIKILQCLLEYLTIPNIIVPLDCFQNRRYLHPLNRFRKTDELACWLIGKEVIPLLQNIANAEKTDFKKKDESKRTRDDNSFLEDEDIYSDDDLILDYECLENIKIHGDLNVLNLFNKQIDFLKNEILHLQHNSSLHPDQQYQIFQHNQDLNNFIKKRNIIRHEFSKHPMINLNSQLSNNLRWRKYWEWIQHTYNFINNKLDRLKRLYPKIKEENEKATQSVNCQVMKNHDVIGLTTTGAAKNQALLQNIEAPIVLVEEAAEILESHIVCSMTKHCQHVILIGDHKQLRPKASVHELGRKFNLNVSLFERMVNVRGNCEQLTYQHRMRPQIAKLICPSIYDKLHNHKVVLEYPNVKGMTNNVFFLNHEYREQFNDNDDSFINEHEVTFLSCLAKHLVLQGYKPTEITILCTYTGQLFAFKKEMSRYELLQEMHVTTVDNFQGEENKIILLSLVRNNGEGNIGFLREENRVCVALSRAREGLYIMGNMDDLIINNKIWPQIKTVLEEDSAIDNALTIKCQIHSDQMIQLKTAEDFAQCPEGGCMQKCNLLLPCGHICTNVCHIQDRDHKKYHCKEPCTKICINNHPCLSLCSDTCLPCAVLIKQTLKCGHTVEIPCSADPETFECPVKVEIILPECDHKVEKLCHLTTEQCKCLSDCDIRLECGHTCTQKCHVRSDPDHLEYQCKKNCTKKSLNCPANHMCNKRCFEDCDTCSVLVDKKRSCGHFYKNVPCSQNIEEVKCKKPCERKIIGCGHKCRLQCSDDCKNCEEKVSKISSCGHTLKVECCKEATPSLCNNKCSKTLPCGHPCTMKCKDQCTVDCKVIVQVDELGLCGHRATMPCYLKNTDPKSPEILKYCEEPCNAKLLCGHICKGNCHKCFQGRLHMSCNERCRKIFICGHPCTSLCSSECLPCKKKCLFDCGHSKCNKICGVPCGPCNKPCLLKCKHQSCKKKCYELCDIKPCQEFCKKILKCGHPCIGYCGDPCPKLCLVCDRKELATIFPRIENSSNAKFLFLPDCGHSVEYEGLLAWVRNSVDSDGFIELKACICPKCQTPIRSCRRLINQIKINLRYFIMLKNKLFFQNEKNMEKIRNQYVCNITQMITDPIVQEMVELKQYIQNIKELGIPFRKKKKQILSFHEVYAFKSIVDILTEVLSLKKQIKLSKIMIEFISDPINIILESLPNKLFMSEQILEDFNTELKRLHLTIVVHSMFSDSDLSLNKTEFDIVIKKLSKLEKFTESLEQEIIRDAAKLSKKNEESFIIDRKIITTAVVDTRSGSWFMCPNNHFYAVDECGRLMESRKCMECNAKIGVSEKIIV